MKYIHSLAPIDTTDIQAALNIFQQPQDPYDEQTKTAVVLYRLGNYQKESFEYFSKFLRKYATRKLLSPLYHELKAYLTYQYGISPYRKLYNYLHSHKYYKAQVAALSMSEDEKEFASSLSTNTTFLAILIFFFFFPKNTRQLFEKKIIKPPSNEVIELLNLFNSLFVEFKRRIIKRMKKYLSNQESENTL